MNRFGILILALSIAAGVPGCGGDDDTGTTTPVDGGPGGSGASGAGGGGGRDPARDASVPGDASVNAGAGGASGEGGGYPDGGGGYPDGGGAGDGGADACESGGACCECDTAPGCQTGCDCDRACGPLRCDAFFLDLAFSLSTEGFLRGLGLSDINNGWAAGDTGTFYRLRDGEWAEASRPTTNAVNDVELSGPDTGWAVGVEILRLESGNWEVVDEAPVLDHPLLALDLADDQNGWAVGEGGIFVELRDGIWSISDFVLPDPDDPLATGKTVHDVDLVDRDNGWAVAEYRAAQLRDGQWSEYPNDLALFGNPEGAYALDLVDRDNGWAVGSNGSVYRLKDGVWEEGLVPIGLNESFRAISLADIDNGYAAGTTFIKLQDGDWSENGGGEGCYNFPTGIMDMQAFGTEGWAVGLRSDSIKRFDEQGYSCVGGQGHASLPLTDIALVGEDEAVAVGHSARMLWLEGGEWHSSNEATGLDVYGVDALSTQNGWAVGQDGLILRVESCDSFNVLDPLHPIYIPCWDVETSPTDTDLYDVAMVSTSEAWAVGGYALGNGEILQYSDGNWVVHETVPADALFAIEMLSESSGWAVGGDPLDKTSIIMRFDNGTWEEAESPTDMPLWDISLMDESNGWAVGGSVSMEGDVQSSVVLRLIDGDWSVVPTDYESVLQSVAVGPDGVGWIVGTRQLVLAVDGTGVKQCPDSLYIPQGGTYDLSAVALTESGRARLVGAQALRAHTL